MPTNIEILVIVLLVINIGVSVYMGTNKKNEYYETPTTKPPIPRIR